ncbi:MAG: hypothetical protein EOO43_07030 [Flavobacterium sp.]|nr:MAG: hypothetical protein EOO43_07030 [Flavobacterium sp.]
MAKGNILILKNSGMLFFRLLCTSVLSLFTARFLINSLGQSDFGLYSVVGGIVVMLTFLNTVMSSTTFRFIAFELGKGEKGEVNKVFNISLVIHIILAITLFVFIEILGVFYVKNYLNILPGKLDDALFVLHLSAFATVTSIVSIPYQGLITANEKFGANTFIEIIRSILSFGVAFFLLSYGGNRLRIYALLIAIVNIVPSFLMYAYARAKFSEMIKWNLQRVRSAYTEMIKYTGWLMFGTISWVGQRQGSDLLVNSFFGTALNASLGIANQVNGIVMVFARNLGQAAIPQITKSVSSDDSDRTKNLVAYITKYTCFLMLVPALPILLETNFLLVTWLGQLPAFTVILCRLLIINALVECLSNGIPSVIMATGKVKLFMILSGLVSLAGLPISYFLFKMGLPPYFIIIVYIGTSTLNVIVSQILLKRLINYDIGFFIKTAYVRIVFVLTLLIPIFFIHQYFEPGLYRFLVTSFSSIFMLAVIVYFVGLEPGERTYLKEAILKIKAKFTKA